jgi:3-phenylpropionate/cinnamic acid dioxygenase small subunit
MSEQRVAELLAKQDIREVLYRYCRGVDRRDYAMIRACYHPDAVDNHGEYLGDVDGFVAHVESNLGRFERTMHFLGNILVELDDDGTRARSEAYAIAYHRLPARREKPERDFVVGLRYVDDFETRDGEWRIANRVCAFEWSRIDPVPEGSNRFTETFLMGRPAADDVVFAPSLDDLPR